MKKNHSPDFFSSILRLLVCTFDFFVSHISVDDCCRKQLYTPAVFWFHMLHTLVRWTILHVNKRSIFILVYCLLNIFFWVDDTNGHCGFCQTNIYVLQKEKEERFSKISYTYNLSRLTKNNGIMTDRRFTVIKRHIVWHFSLVLFMLCRYSESVSINKYWFFHLNNFQVTAKIHCNGYNRIVIRVLQLFWFVEASV